MRRNLGRREEIRADGRWGSGGWRDDDGSGRVTLIPFGRWTHDMDSQATGGFQFLTYTKTPFLFLGPFTH